MQLLPQKSVYECLKFIRENLPKVNVSDTESRERIGECEARLDDIIMLLGFHEEQPQLIPLRLCKAGELHTKR
jgi:hypothetical protein